MSTWMLQAGTSYPTLDDVPNQTGTGTIPEWTAPYPIQAWILEQGTEYPTIRHVQNPTATGGVQEMKSPYPHWMWRLGYDRVYTEYPYIDVDTAPIELAKPFEEIPPIIVYPPDTRVFENNGLRALSPITAIYTVAENNAGELYVEHPMDSDGDWNSLIRGYILLAPIPRRGKTTNQPFRIYRVVKKRGSDGKAIIAVYARHVFYDLNYCMLDDVRPENKNGDQALEHIFENVLPTTQESRPQELFSYYSNIESLNTAYYQWKTVVSALIGDDNSFINRWGGSLYVDGYYFSICEPMEYSKQNAFQLDYRSNLESIEQDIDDTSCYTALYAEDNHGNSTYLFTDLEESGMAFHKVLHASFSYDDTIEDTSEMFAQDVQSYFESLKELQTKYTCKVSEIPKDDTDYGGFRFLDDFEVGDTGIVWDLELGIESEQKITKKTVDLLTFRTTETILENAHSLKSWNSAYSSTVTVKNTADRKRQEAMQSQIDEISQATYIPYCILSTSGKAIASNLKHYAQYIPTGG